MTVQTGSNDDETIDYSFLFAEFPPDGQCPKDDGGRHSGIQDHCGECQ
jgi:hypothetical protein